MSWYKRHKEQSSLGELAADKLASFVGSWTFVWIQCFVMAFWIVGNVYLILHFDPFPFIFLNLFMSAEAAFSTPIIMMSQNRQADRDRHQADADYVTNLTAKRDIEELMEHVARLEVQKLDALVVNLKNLLETYGADRIVLMAAAHDHIAGTMKAHGRRPKRKTK